METETLVPPPSTQPEQPSTPPKDTGERGEALFDNTLSAFRDRILDKAKEAKPAEEKKTEEKKPESAPAEKPPTPPEVKAAKPEQPEKKQEQAAEPEPEPAQPPKRRRRQPDEHEIANIAATAAAKASAETLARLSEEKKASAPQPPPKPAESDLGFDVPDETQYKLDIIGEMESDPKYKGKKAEYIKWLKEVDQYERKWQEDHPDEEFDPDSADHNKIFAKEPNLPPRDYDLARLRLSDRGRENEEVKKLRAEQAELRAKLVEQELAPEISSRGRAAVASILSAINPDYGKYASSEEQLRSLSKDDPDALHLAAPVAQHVVPFITEVVKLWEPRGVTKFDSNNPVHAEIAELARDFEDGVQRLPEAEQVRNGKRFVTMADWHNMSESARKTAWSFLDKDVLISFRVAKAVHDTAVIVAETEKRFEAYAKRKGLKRETSPEPPKAEPPKPAATPEKSDYTPPPVGGARSAVDTSTTPAPSKPADFGDFFLSKMRGH